MTTPGIEVFPTLQSCTKLATGKDIFDVKFWPYGAEDDDQIFAFTGDRDTLVCRPKLGSDPSFEILKWFRDDDENCSYNSLVWTKDPETRKPLLCVAGHEPKHIKILDVESGEAVRTLAGHGKGVNDLAVSPLSTNIIASGAEDSTIRLWNIHPDQEEQPCVALLGGEGHKAPVLAIHFHPNGHWLLSGGIDTAVCLWALPSLDELERRDPTSRQNEPMIVYYPHFFTKELHPNYVDCFAFYGDFIISKAARDQDAAMGANENEILLWRIEGFNSENQPAEHPPVPIPGQRTRSAFPHDQPDEEGTRGFARLLTFSIPHTDRFYHRFGLLHSPGLKPILCMGTQESKYLFWDLQRIEQGIDLQDRPTKKQGKKPAARGKKTPFSLNDIRSESEAASSSGQTPDASTTTGAPPRDHTLLSDRFKPLEPHHSKIANTKLSKERHFASSQIAWSPDGRWMVAVGDLGVVCVFHRPKSVVGAGGVD